MKNFPACILFCAFLAGCSGISDFLTGRQPKSCDESDYASADVTNSTDQALTVSFCSPNESLPANSQALDPGSADRYITAIPHVKTEDVQQGDTCRDEGDEGGWIGTQVPQLSTHDATLYEVCFTSYPSTNQQTYPLAYQIVTRAQGCPADSLPLAQAHLHLPLAGP